MKKFKVIFYCPVESTVNILHSIAKHGFGRIGNYDSWSAVMDATEYFRPLDGATPTVGNIGKLTKVSSHRIEILCLEKEISSLITIIRELHPYEQPAIDVLAQYPVD